MRDVAAETDKQSQAARKESSEVVRELAYAST